MEKPKFSRKEQNKLFAEGKKGCSCCGEILDLDYFGKQATKLGYRAYCKYCRHLHDRKKNARPPLPKDDFYHKLKCETSRGERDYIKKIQREHKVSFEEARDLYLVESCEICGSKKADLQRGLCVDHCHTTGKIRGVLCNFCNSGLGLFRDSLDSLTKAIEYLKQSKKDGH